MKIRCKFKNYIGFNLFFVFICSMNLYAQPVKVGEIVFTNNVKSVQVFDSCKSENLKYIFDVKGRNSVLINNDSWEDRTVNTYDDNDNLLSTIQYRDNIPKYKVIYNYINDLLYNVKETIDDLIKSEENFFYIGSVLVEKHVLFRRELRSITKYKYQNDIIRATTTDYPENITSFSLKYVSGKNTTIKYYDEFDRDKPGLTKVILYDDNKNVIEYTELYQENTKSVSILNNGVLSAKRIFINDFVLSSETIYDDHGSVISDEDISNRSKWTFNNQYDKNSNIILAEVYLNGIMECSISYKIEYY